MRIVASGSVLEAENSYYLLCRDRGCSYTERLHALRDATNEEG